jgi:hypothetical protein
MKNLNKIVLLLVGFVLISLNSIAQIKGLVVETYYISDANDATDTTSGRFVDAGSKTYRVYLELDSGSKIKSVYGDANHAMIIRSSERFYNNIDRPTAYFGYLINKSWFNSNPTLALDSWLTIGSGLKTYGSVLKSDDTDGSFIGGTNNGGGSSSIPGGLLVNNDPAAGIPVTSQDGVVADTAVYGPWFDNGFKDINGDDSTAFGSLVEDSIFFSNNCLLQQNSGVDGVLLNINKVLIGQFTTKGDLRFELNAEVILADGSILKYVANDSILLSDERVSPFLKYPLACGCQDPDYLEYNAAYSCTNNDSCKTLIKFGCMDSLACNFDPEANFSISTLCCYPGYCNDNDISLVCPEVNNGRIGNFDFEIFPNPAEMAINFKLMDSNNESTIISIYDAFGNKLWERVAGVIIKESTINKSIIELTPGLYLARVIKGDKSYSKLFMKN